MVDVLRRMVVVVAVAGMLGGLTGPTRGGDGKEVGDEAAWSAEVNGVKARIKLERDYVIVGTTVIGTRLELKQGSPNPLKFAWSRATLKIRVEDGDGKELASGGVGYSGSIPERLDLVLPPKAELSFDPASHGAIVAGGQLAQFCMGPEDAWLIPRDGKDYFVKGTLEIAQVGHDAPWFGWYGKIEIPAVKIPTKAETMDPVAAGKLIEAMGSKMVGKDREEAKQAARRLSLIKDDRVIPWYVKALETDDEDLRLAAIMGLWEYARDDAAGGSKDGAGTQKKEATDSSATKAAEESTKGTRFSVALELARSAHPEARKMLLSMWQDSAASVRMVVVQSASAMDTAESLAILAKMSKDADEGVRKEAVRCLKVRESKVGPATGK